MKRTRLSIRALLPWAQLNAIELSGVEAVKLENGHGCGVVATRDIEDEDAVFIRVPSELVLSKDLVWEYARSDPDLRQVLEAMGEWAKTPQGSIILFLLIQITASSEGVTDRIGLSNPFTDYVKFLPDERGVPSRWSEQELECLWGTSLQNHMAVKQHSLEALFDDLRQATQNIPWCAKWWWNKVTGVLTLDDFKEVDSMFRSRAMDFGEQGQSLVPVMDMANHDHASRNNALYEIDKSSGDAMLVLHTGRCVRKGSEVTINYGSDRSASDLLHAYGFIEDMPHAGSMFVSFPRNFAPFEADPLAGAKYVGLKLVPGVKFYVSDSARVRFHSPFIYAMSVNEEDGLGWDVARTVGGEREFHFLYHDVPIDDAEHLVSKLQEDALWDLFQWRAHAYLSILLDDVKKEIDWLNRRPLEEKLPEGITLESPVWRVSEKLRQLEHHLIQMVLADFEHRLDHLQNSDVVIRWSRGELDMARDGISTVSSSLNLKSEGGTGVADAADYEPTEQQEETAHITWGGDDLKETTESGRPHEQADTVSILEEATGLAANIVDDRNQIEPTYGSEVVAIRPSIERKTNAKEGLPMQDLKTTSSSEDESFA